MTNAPEPSGFRSERSTPANAPWTWRCLGADGQEVDADGIAATRFASQGDAESWVGEQWRELLDAGVESVVLLEADREVYGPMSLRPAGG